MKEGQHFKYDVFLSHASTDKPRVRKLAERLMADGLKVWVDEWEILPGDMINKKIEDGLEASRVLLLAMSSHAFASEWVALESAPFRFCDPTNKERRLIPLRLDDSEIKFAFRPFRYVDWRGESDAAYQELFKACKPQEDALNSAGPPKSRAVELRKKLPPHGLAFVGYLALFVLVIVGGVLWAIHVFSTASGLPRSLSSTNSTQQADIAIDVMLPSIYGNADILVDGVPAKITNRTPTIATILVGQRDAPHKLQIFTNSTVLREMPFFATTNSPMLRPFQ